MDPDDATPGKRPPAPSAPRPTVTLLLRKMRAQAHLEGLNPDIRSADDYAIVDPDINKRGGPHLARGDHRRAEVVVAPPNQAGAATQQRQGRHPGGGPGGVQAAL